LRRYESARDLPHRAIAVLACAAFDDPAARASQTWNVLTRREIVLGRCKITHTALEFRQENSLRLHELCSKEAALRYILKMQNAAAIYI
jgi:hypothetical protein